MPIHRRNSIAFTAALVVVASACASSNQSSSAPSTDKETGAVSSLSEKEVSSLRPLRIEELLKGKVAGLQIIQLPSGAVTLRIRGGDRSVRTDVPDQGQEPLVVVDGIQIQTGTLHTALAGLLPEDIKSVEVLKDVASTSIYGTRGAAGVVVITTKREN